MMIMHSCFKQIPLHPNHNYQHIRSNVPRVILPVVLSVRIVLVFIVVVLVIVLVDVGIRFDNNYYPPVLLLRLLLLLPVTVIRSYEFPHRRHLQSYGKYQNRSRRRRRPEVVAHSSSIRIRLYTRPLRPLNSYNSHHFHHPHTQ